VRTTTAHMLNRRFRSSIFLVAYNRDESDDGDDHARYGSEEGGNHDEQPRESYRQDVADGLPTDLGQRDCPGRIADKQITARGEKPSWREASARSPPARARLAARSERSAVANDIRDRRVL
jgi:hypothetical protein